ncbi:hypothetical protein DRQ53_04585 [bacterium]|nr:MAG: hypothetical protein DRQ53_04585 [bacterium]
MRTLISCSALALLLFAAGAQAQEKAEEGGTFTEAGEGGAVLPEMVVEAENEVRQQIEKEGYEFELSAAIIDSFFTITDEEALAISPVSGLQPHLNNLERLASNQPPHYWLREMAGQPVATFYPQEMEGHDAKSWRLDITDFKGTTFKSFSGGSGAPDDLEWDGRGDNGEILQAGYPYSYVFTVTDKGTNTYTHAGVSFRIPALDHRDKDARVLALAGDELFIAAEAGFRPRGERWLTKATDMVRQHPYSPVRVHVVAESMSLAVARANAVADFLSTEMILPREQIETEAEQRQDLRAELDGTVKIVIEHAD